MKDECHHLKHLQKKVIRSIRKDEVEVPSKTSLKDEKVNEKDNSLEVYDEFIPANQQIPRAPGRLSYH